MTKNLRLPLSMDITAAVEFFSEKLQSDGWTVDTKRNGWRVLKAQKYCTTPTFAYHGLTSDAKSPRLYLKIVGPEENIFVKLLQDEMEQSK